MVRWGTKSYNLVIRRAPKSKRKSGDWKLERDRRKAQRTISRHQQVWEAVQGEIYQLCPIHTGVVKIYWVEQRRWLPIHETVLWAWGQMGNHRKVHALEVALIWFRSENCLKNRFYGGLRRLIRKINKVEKDHKLRKSKPLRYETLLRLLDYQASCE